jgi:hypothetical protein
LISLLQEGLSASTTYFSFLRGLFNDAFNIKSIYRRFVAWRLNGKDFEESSRSPTDVLSCNLPGGAEKNDENPQLG